LNVTISQGRVGMPFRFLASVPGRIKICNADWRIFWIWWNMNELQSLICIVLSDMEEWREWRCTKADFVEIFMGWGLVVALRIHSMFAASHPARQWQNAPKSLSHYCDVPTYPHFLPSTGATFVKVRKPASPFSTLSYSPHRFLGAGMLKTPGLLKSCIIISSQVNPMPWTQLPLGSILDLGPVLNWILAELSSWTWTSDKEELLG